MVVRTTQANRLVRRKLPGARIPGRPGPSQPLTGAESLFFTAGLGDFLTIESFMTPEDTSPVRTIYLATAQHVPITQLCNSGIFPNLKSVELVWNDWSQRSCFLYKSEYLNAAVAAGKKVPDGIADATDWSICAAFPSFERGNRPFRGSTFLRRRTDLSKFGLPDRYAILLPQSVNQTTSTRNLSPEQLRAAASFLADRKLPGVVLGTGRGMDLPKGLIDLTNQTTAVESASIVVGGCTYVGIDTWGSVLAAQALTADRLAIKPAGGHTMRWRRVYFAPHREFPFVTTDFVGRLEAMRHL